MQRDMGLVRKILLEVQSRGDLRPRPVEIEGADPVVTARHVEMLLDAKLIEGVAHKSNRGPGAAYILVTELSWEGHDFIAALQDETVWGQLKQKFSPAQLATLPLGLVKDRGMTVLRKAAFAQLGMDA